MNSFTATLLALALLPGTLTADHVSLENGDTLTGSILGIDAGGRLVIDSENAAAPLQLRGSALLTAIFDVPAPPKTSSNQERLNLVNGDVLPGTVRSIGADHVDLHTWYAGDLRIPRKSVSSVDFGIAPQKLAYKGPGGPEGWLDVDQWKFVGDGLVSSGRGTASRPKVLPSNFILRFRLGWINHPNFRFYFCDDLLKNSGETDRYYFEINQGGMQLKRQAADSNRSWFPLYSSQRRPKEFPDGNVDIELRVDRQRHFLYIYIDGELEGRYPDRIDNVPTGTGIMVESTGGGDVKNILSSIEVYQWDAVSQLHRSEGHEDTSMDAIITTDSQRYAGDAQKLVAENDERIILLKNAHADEPLRVPVRRTSVLYLRQDDKIDVPADLPGMLSIEMTEHGSIHFSNPLLNAETLSGEHPLLGPMTIKRGALKRIDATSASAESEDSP